MGRWLYVKNNARHGHCGIGISPPPGMPISTVSMPPFPLQTPANAYSEWDKVDHGSNAWVHATHGGDLAPGFDSRFQS